MEAEARSRADKPSLIPFRDHTLNELGYEALKIARDVDLAVALFEMNAGVHPAHWNMHDSLGEGLAARGDIDAAIRSYERSLELFPGNYDGAAVLVELRSRRKTAAPANP